MWNSNGTELVKEQNENKYDMSKQTPLFFLFTEKITVAPRCLTMTACHANHKHYR
jgi:hypothetical protein